MNDNSTRLSAERHTASLNKRPVVYVGQPLPQLLARARQAIERGEVEAGQIIAGTDNVGLPFVEVIPA